MGLLNNICVAYIDDILIFSNTREEHTTHVRQVLGRLWPACVYVKLLKCAFYMQEVDFLGYCIEVAGVLMNPRKVITIEEWAELKSFHDIQVFIGFVNFYRRFIRGFSAITAPMTNLLKDMKKGKKKRFFK